MIYLDNAATGYQKPESVYQAADRALRACSGNPGRSGHRVSLEAGRAVQDARRTLQQLFHTEYAEEISFTLNATMALNQAIHGIARPGMHIITSALEHNSVARPLEYLRSRIGIRLTVLPVSVDEGVDPQQLRNALRKDTGLVVINHISNVTGTQSDLAELGKICREAEIPFLVDASQSAGNHVIDVQEMCIDLLACPGHKGLLGPQGTGILYARKNLQLSPLLQGGTGSFSELLFQPEEVPDRYESGTVNVPGIAGLAAGVRFLLDTGIGEVEKTERALTEQLLEGLSSISGVTVYAPRAGSAHRGAVLSARIEGCDPQEAAMILDSAFGIAVRAGLHCAPYAHRLLDTLDRGGTIRFSPDLFNTPEEIDACIEAVEQIAQEYGI